MPKVFLKLRDKLSNQEFDLLTNDIPAEELEDLSLVVANVIAILLTQGQIPDHTQVLPHRFDYAAVYRTKPEKET